MDRLQLKSQRVALGRQLRSLRDDRHVTQIELANRLGVPQSWVSTVEAGGRRLELGEIVSIIRALSLDPAAEISSIIEEITQ